MTAAQVLDPCCGSRMFWFDKQDQRVLFGDIRSEQHTLCDGRVLNITPDIAMDFRAMPLPDDSFGLVVFDPPHLTRAGARSWMGKKYGILGEDWRGDIRRGFAECFRVLAPGGVLIFKWADVQVTVTEILRLTPHRPLFGHKSGRLAKTHWMTFMKPGGGHRDREAPAARTQTGASVGDHAAPPDVQKDVPASASVGSHEAQQDGVPR